MKEYLKEIIDILTKIETEEKAIINRVSELVAKTIKDGGLVFVFGCGHSHLPGLDAHYRAGGLANVSPILDTDLMLHNGAAKSSRMEKMSGLAGEILRRYTPTDKDLLFIFSASGKNRVPIEMAIAAKVYGINTVGVSSLNYIHHGGELHKYTDYHIDCKIPYGDACIDVGNAKMGGLSTYSACFILNSCLIQGAMLADSEGFDVPIYISGNVEGGREHNVILENKYLGRVKHL